MATQADSASGLARIALIAFLCKVDVMFVDGAAAMFDAAIFCLWKTCNENVQYYSYKSSITAKHVLCTTPSLPLGGDIYIVNENEHEIIQNRLS